MSWRGVFGRPSVRLGRAAAWQIACTMWVIVRSGLEKGRAVEIDADGVTIGSGAGCVIALSDPDIAPLAASLRLGDEGDVELIPIEPAGEARVVTAGETLNVGDAELELLAEQPAETDPSLDEQLAAALGSDGPHADEDLPPARERRRVNRATALALTALGVALLAGVLALTGVLGGDDDPDVSALVREAEPSTVRVVSRDGSTEGSGTGWVLDAKEGLVVTNFHVVNGASETTVAVEGAERDAQVLGAAPCDDLAVVKVEDTDGLKQLSLAEPDSIQQGESVVAVGFAAGASDGEKLTSTTGVVSVASQPLRSPQADTPNFPDMIQTDAAINPGNSGGPLLDGRGRLVGVNTAVLMQQGGVPLQNVGYAIGVGRVQEVVSELRRGRSTSWLGTGLEFPPPAQLRKQGLPRGVVTLSAAPDTPAAKAGLKGKSVLITTVDGRRLKGTLPNWCDATRGAQSGDSVSLGVVPKPGAKVQRVALAVG